jgi:hypothetical protein
MAAPSELKPGLTVEIRGDLAAYLAMAFEGVDVEAAGEVQDRYDELPEEEREMSVHDAPTVLHRMNVRATVKSVRMSRCSRIPVGKFRHARPRERRPSVRRVTCSSGSRGDPSPGDDDPPSDVSPPRCPA